MNNRTTGTAATLALRREALIAQCAMQRIMVAAQARAILSPATPAGWRKYINPGMRVPLAIAGVVLGVLLTRPGRARSLLSAGTALWRIVRTLLPILRPRPDSGE